MWAIGDQPGLDSAGEKRRVLLTHDEYLGHRLRLHAVSRAVVVVVILVGAWFAGPLFGVRGLDAAGLSWLALAIACYDAVILLLIRPRLAPERTVRVLPMLRGVLYGSILLDYIALTVAIWMLGGSRSPFLAFYLFHVIIASLLLSRSAAWSAAIIAWLLLAALVAGEHSGLVPPRVPEGLTPGGWWLHDGTPPDGRYLLILLGVYGVLFLLTAALLTGIAEMLRRGERTCRESVRQFEQLSELRRDFLHITTHNLQSPVGAVTMLLRNLESGLCGPLTDGQRDQVRRALVRLDELSAFLADLRTLTRVEGEGAELRTDQVDIRALLSELIEANSEAAAARGHRVVLETADPLPIIRTSQRLLREAVANYITNAIKYTPDGGMIRVRALPAEWDTASPKPARAVRIEVVDNGIGIPEADQRRLFNERVRLATNDPRLGRVEGTGLGLSIVRRVIDALGGRGGVLSEPGRGSTFWIELPVD